MNRSLNPKQHQDGFTLLELVVAITVLAVIGVVIANIIRQPIDASIEIQRRAAMANEADQLMNRISRDVRLALPNSIRVSADGLSLELLSAPQGGRYRAFTATGGTGDVLDFSQPDSSFDILSPFPSAPEAGQLIVIYNLTANNPQSNAWSGSNRATVGTGSTFRNVVLQTPMQFPYPSPAQRFYLVTGPVQYRCQADGLWRYDGYPIQTTLTAPPSNRGQRLSGALDVCQFRYDPGTLTRFSLTTVSLGITREGERLLLEKAIHGGNVP
jgi:MSHA biogenesis protein MshO